MEHAPTLEPMGHERDWPERHIPPPEFGHTLRTARQRTGKGLRAIAAACRTTYGYLGMLERNERAPSESMAEELIKALRLVGEEAETIRRHAVRNKGRDWPGHEARDRNRERRQLPWYWDSARL
jgi:transcriptional regulator with XRE-family HTH domain